MKESLTCPICGKEFQTLNSHIHFKHKLSTEEFLKQYPNTKLVSDQIKKSVSKTCKKSGCGKWMKGYEYPEWRIKQYQEKFSGEGNTFFGKNHSKKTRKKMSDNHADFTGDKNPFKNWLKKDDKNIETFSKILKKAWGEKFKDENARRLFCENNSKTISKLYLNGFNPYTNCERGWFQSNKFNNKFYYCSSYEKLFLEFCESSDKIGALQRPDFVIPYKDESDKLRNYYADFFINNDVLIEIKPKSMMNYNHNREKINAGKEYCKNMGYEYKVLTEEELKDLNKVL